MGVSRTFQLKKIPAIANHLTLEEREVIAPMHLAEQIQVEARSEQEHDFPCIAALPVPDRTLRRCPRCVNQRDRFDDEKDDRIVGAAWRDGAITPVEPVARKSGYTLLGRVSDLRSETLRPNAAEAA